MPFPGIIYNFHNLSDFKALFSMLLLLTDALLLLFITFNLGILSLQALTRMLGSPPDADPLGIFLLGLIPSTIYFNLISFWLPVNFLSLLPLLAASCWISFRRWPSSGQILLSFRNNLRLLQTQWLPAMVVLFLFFLYLFKPSTSPDSSGYHSIAIGWYEHFKVVPGLGNLHGRLAFNPASFIIAAAYSLTGLTGQSIYPLNGVMSTLFLLWILVRLLRHSGAMAGYVYLFLLTLFFRPLLGYMSSPSSDPPVLICTGYALLLLFERLLSPETITLPRIALPLIIALYAPATKISAAPMLLVCGYVFLLLPSRDRKRLLLPLSAIAACIYMPWMGRNYILSGYLTYPLPFTHVFHPDWQIPREMLEIDYDYARFSARTISNTYPDFLYLEHAPFRKWFFRLIPFQLSVGLYYEWVLMALSLFSPLFWLFHLRKKPRTRIFLYWLAVYTCTWIWTINSMDYRFGLVFILLPIILPLLSLAAAGQPSAARAATAPNTRLWIAACLCLVSGYYAYGDYRLMKNYYASRCQGFSAREGWLLPMKDALTYTNNRKEDFPYRIMRSGQPLYLDDSTHNWLNADRPCQFWDYGWRTAVVEMRGEHLDQGFKTVKVVPLIPLLPPHLP